MPEKSERLAVSYTNLSEKYLNHSSNYNKQFCSIYLIRLQQMTKLLDEQIKKKWSDKYPVLQLHKLAEVAHSKCIVIGTLFKDQKLKPSVLKQLAESNQLVPQPIRSHFTDSSDELYIEDELQRYRIIGSLKPDFLVTGISCALLGTDDGKGKFTVEDCLFADFRPQIARPLLQTPSFVVFLSGLDLVHSEKTVLSLQLLLHWLSGLLGPINEIEPSKVVRVVLAGNSLQNRAEILPSTISMLSRRSESVDSIIATKLFDTFLANLCNLIDVDVMPGENDPSNNILPQKPMHGCMFPKTRLFESFNSVSNPHWFAIGGVKMLGSSGQPVLDLMRFSEIGNGLEALEACLKWSHLAPTAPDTLGCFPFYESDPFIIEECPHVFFAGNQAKFETKMVKGPEEQQVRLLTIPEFSETFEACILNLQSLDCFTINFNTTS